MKQIFRLAAVLLAVAAFAACSQRTKEEVLADFEQLYVQTESKCSDFSAKDWDKYEKKCKALETELAKFEFTNSEKLTINRLRVKHAGLSLQAKAQRAGESIKEAASEVSDAVKDAAEDAAKAVKSLNE